MAGHKPTNPTKAQIAKEAKEMKEFWARHNAEAKARTEQYIWAVNVVLSGLQAIHQPYEVREERMPQRTIVTIVNPSRDTATKIVIDR